MRGEVPHPWLDSIPWCVTGFPASTSWDDVPGVPGGQDTRFTDSSPAGWSLGEARDWRAGWVARPGAPSPFGVPPLGRPSALGEALGAPGLARLPGFLCPDGKRLYTLRGAPSPSLRCGCECQTGRLLPKVTLSLPGWGGVTARGFNFCPFWKAGLKEIRTPP